MEQDQSRENSGILDDQSRLLHLNPPNVWKHRFEEDDASNADDRAYELRENPKKSWRLTIIHRSFESAPNVQETSLKCHKELQSIKSLSKKHSAKATKSFPCKICGSKFNTVRGLNGHMRIHSTRTAIIVTPSPAPSSSEHETLPKKKRSKSLRSQFSEEEIQSAETLLTLSTAGNPSSPSGEPNQSISDQTHFAFSPESELKFRCKICDRRFASYQQLGGHQTSHRLSKGSSVKTESTTGNSCEDEHHNISAEFDSDGCFAGKVFNCETCGRVFGSGQALGGHKRAHWDKEREDLFDGIVPSLQIGKNTSFWSPKIDAATTLLAL